MSDQVQPQDVIDAWASMKTWVEGQLPDIAHTTPINDRTSDVGKSGACNILNGLGESSLTWVDDGDGSITVSGQTLSVSGVAIQPAKQNTDGTMSLPFAFTKLQIDGTYAFTQPCGLYDMTGKKSNSSSSDDHGTLTQSTSGGTVAYTATLGTALSISGVIINAPALNTQFSPDTGPLPSWLVGFAKFVSTAVNLAFGFNESQTITSGTANVFASPAVCGQLTTVLDAQLNPST